MSGVGAVILAAGEGRRFGQPKALAVSDGRAWVEIAVETLRAAGLTHVVVVLGAKSEQVRRLLPPDLEIAENPDWPQGRTGSIQRGLSALGASGASGALLHQVDFPEVRSGSVRRILAAWHASERAESRILVPRHAERPGHPVLLGREIWPEVMALGPGDPLSRVVRRQPGRVIEVPVDDPGIHRNRNVPATEGEG